MKPRFPVIANINVQVLKIIDTITSLFVFPAYQCTRNPKAHVFWAQLACVVLIMVADGTTTTVVVVKGPTYIVIGADSLITVSKANQNIPTLGCKIMRVGNTFVGMAGTVGYTEAGGFNAYHIAKRVIVSRGTTTISMAAQFEHAARLPFLKFVRKYRQGDPTGFSHDCENKQCLQVVFATMEHGSPVISIGAFMVTVAYGGIRVKPVSPMNCPGQACPTENMQAILGFNEEANQLFNGTQHFFIKNGLIAGIEKLIDTEQSAHPSDVGGPLSILMLSSTGPQWVPGYQGMCPDVRAQK